MMASELETMATLLASKNKDIETLKKQLKDMEISRDKYSERATEYSKQIRELEARVASPYNADTVKALMDAHEIIRGENKELHKRVDAAYAGVAMDASARKHYLQAIIERLDGIKSSVEVALKD
jgi:chromosome segregation ATPase